MSKRSPLDLSKAIKRSATPDAARTLLTEQNQNKQFVPLEQISDRIGSDTRVINEKHAQELAESIAVIGLIAPLTVDRHYRLLAGGHRRVALQFIRQAWPDRFAELFKNGVPVYIIDIDATTDVVDALQIEVEENTQRKNYTTEEIREAARKLEEAGYERLRGRPADGQKSLNRELMSVFRLSRRRITEILNEPSEKSEHPCALSKDLKQYETFLRQSEKFHRKIMERTMEDTQAPELQKIRRDLGRIIKNLETLIDKRVKENLSDNEF
ncbi:plasmid partitioning protein (plasmid) [Picosynechococcus sp. PCC 11901]|uniref:ParB/RepB/Spo0J family partition protein n=1 Tax=Picosynechococcus sp. PCC 11901 TaxID=2579791 RepID=UPI0010FC2DA3|nr:ParB/RepB/Spo0J family partition protein [Picosynechococcus sp. PCC 11901]QCS48051.1 plasmid partitioning protein [Picosynechococcus sp. PCC 11901]